MQLYITDYSPFARIARVVLREKRLKSRVDELVAITRSANSTYYKINPSGRVPYLTRDDGVGIEGSQPISYFLDHFDGVPILEVSGRGVDLKHRILEEYARSLLDGVSVWLRELRRAPQDRSKAVIEHECQRLERLADYWEGAITHPLMQGNINMAQITLACALLLEEWYPALEWRKNRPRLSSWADCYIARRSFIDTRPREILIP